MAERSGDTALDFAEALGNSEPVEITLIQSGVAPLFPLAAALHIKRPFAPVPAPKNILTFCLSQNRLCDTTTIMANTGTIKHSGSGPRSPLPPVKPLSSLPPTEGEGFNPVHAQESNTATRKLPHTTFAIRDTSLTASMPFAASDGEKVAQPDEVSAESGKRVGARCRIPRSADSFRAKLHPNLQVVTSIHACHNALFGQGV